MRLATTLCLLLCVAGAMAIGPSWYQCDPTTCTTPACQCPSTSPPGGLTPSQTPQFVLLQHSMAMEEVAYGLMEGIRKGFNNPNGCPIPMTWFGMMYHSNCTTAWDAYERGDEIAMQTNRYTPVFPFNQIPRDSNPRYDNFGNLTKEIEMSRNWWNSACKIPFKDMNGFRSPELVHNPPVREALKKIGFLYDATINEYYASYSTTSPSKSEVLWPYTMDNGIPQDCNFTGVEVAFCRNADSKGEKYEGLWEVPLYQMQDKTGGFLGNADYGMDKSIGSYDVYEVLKQNFDDRYNGNRAPFPVAVNIKWLNVSSNAKALRKFIEYTLTKPDTYFINTQDLVHWMQNAAQFPVDKVGSYLTCTEPGVRNTPTGLASDAQATADALAALAPAPTAAAPAPAPAVATPVAAAPAPAKIVRPIIPTPNVTEPAVGTASTSGAVSVSAGVATLAALAAALALLA